MSEMSMFSRWLTLKTVTRPPQQAITKGQVVGQLLTLLEAWFQ